MEILIFIIVFVAGWYSRELYALYKVKVILKKIESSEKISENLEIVHINIEKHDGTLFVYSSEDGSFMAQGKNRDELENNLKERYPDVVFGASNANLEKVGFK